MDDSIRRRLGRGLLALVALLAVPAVARAQQGITGKVTEQGTGRPVEAAQVNIVGTTLGAITNGEGRYQIRGVPAGTHQIRVLRVGYSEAKRSVTVAAGQTATLDIEIGSVAVSLAPVVTTATGEQRRVEIGNAVTQIQASKVTETAPISSVNDVLNSRAPGVVVTTGTQTGSAARIRIRGQSSISLSNDPIYVIDGVRMTSNVNSSNLFTGGAQPGRTGDINPDDIESIEIVKGPSAATLYGTDAANGVIVIQTKKGRAGAAQWNVHGELGALEDRNEYPTAFTIFGKQANGTAAPLNFCNLPRVSAGICTVDSVAKYSPFKDKDVTPLQGGSRYSYGAQVRGGSDLVTYFVTGNKENETGVLGLPDFERRRLDSLNVPIREWTLRPNALIRNSFRVNLNSSPNSKLDLALQTGYFNVDQRFSNESNATAGLGSQIFGGPGCKICAPDRRVGIVNGANGLPVAPGGSPLYGYRAWTPGYSWQEKLQQRVDRFIGSASANWRPTTWWSNRLQFGTDFTDRVDDNLLYNGEGPPITSTYQLGFKDNTRTNLRNVTADLASSATWTPRPWLNFKTTAGAQYVSYSLQYGEAYGENLPPGAQTPNGGATRLAFEQTTQQKTLGLYVEEGIAIRDRLFLTGALRTDQNSAFGTNFQRVYYPKAQLSWIISDESFFPQMAWMNSLRVRAAYGAAGVQPGPNDALRSYRQFTASVNGVDLPGAVSDLPGNTELKPERSSEIETGFETKLFNSRVNVDFTYYRKRTKDALIDAILAPSYGIGSRTIKRNLGAVQNQGMELSVNSQLVDRRAFAFDLTLNGSTNSNQVLSLGGTPPQIGTTNRVVEGYPIWGLWARPITGWQDKNKDGILTYNADPNLNEVFVGDSATYRGYAQPRYILTAIPGFDLLNRRLRIQGLFDYRGGHKWYNNTERIRCVSRQNCSGLMNPGADFQDQAMVVGTRDHPSRTLDGFFQDGEFVKLREVSLSYTLPSQVAQRWTKARSLTLVGTARNLYTWTKYRGVDPESDYVATTGSDAPSEFQTIAAPTYFIFRVNIGF